MHGETHGHLNFVGLSSRPMTEESFFLTDSICKQISRRSTGGVWTDQHRHGSESAFLSIPLFLVAYLET